MSILNRHFSTPYNTAPFSKIKNEAFLPSFKIAIEKARKEIDAIVENLEHPTFKNTIEALEYSGQELDRISSIFFNLNSAETNNDIQTPTKHDVSQNHYGYIHEVSIREW